MTNSEMEIKKLEALEWPFSATVVQHSMSAFTFSYVYMTEYLKWVCVFSRIFMCILYMASNINIVGGNNKSRI